MQKDDRVDIFSIRRIWVDAALKVFSIKVIVYTIFLIRHETAKAQPVMETVQAIVGQLAVFIPVATGFTLILFQGVDFIMFLTQIYKARLQRKIMQARSEGIAEGKAEGIEQGKVEIYRTWYADWERRRQAAAEKGIPFDDPPPFNPNTISN